MPKKEKTPRILTCQRSGETFEYIGFGRPPKYCPRVAAEVRKEQRRDAQRAKRAAAKGVAVAARASALGVAASP